MGKGSGGSSSNTPTSKDESQDVSDDGIDSDSSSNQLTTNIILLYFALICSGIIVGYLGFFIVYSSSCHNLLEETAQKHKINERFMNDKYNKILSSYNECERTTKESQELHEMKGRVEAHNELAERHQDLLEKHEKVLARVSELQKTQDGSATLVQSLRDNLRDVTNQLDTKSQELRESNQQKNILQATLQKRLELSQKLLQDNLKEIADVKGQYAQCNQTTNELLDQISTIQGHISRRQHGMTIMRYGESPYTVEFTLSFPSTNEQQQSSHFQFEVLVDAVNEMPHTVWTFLNLVKHGFYDGTNFVISDGTIIKGGNPKDANAKVRSKITRKYAEFGYGITPLTFTEVAPKYPCAKFGLSLHSRGPDIVIHMTDDGSSQSLHLHDTATAAFEEDDAIHSHHYHSEDDSLSCLGKILRGRETLQRIADSPRDKEGYLQKNINIVSARILEHNNGNQQEQEQQQTEPPGHHDEF